MLKKVVLAVGLMTIPLESHRPNNSNANSNARG